MERLQRFYQKIFGKDSNENERYVIGYFAEQGACSQASDIGDAQSNGNFEGGLPSIVVGDNSPVIGDINSLYWIITHQLAYLLQSGVPEWDKDTTYYKGNIVNENGVLYICDDDDNGNGITNINTTSLNWKMATPYNKKLIALNRFKGVSNPTKQTGTNIVGFAKKDGTVIYGSSDWYNYVNSSGDSVSALAPDFNFGSGEVFSSIVHCESNDEMYAIGTFGRIIRLSTDTIINTLSGNNTFLKIFDDIMVAESDDDVIFYKLNNDGTATQINITYQAFSSDGHSYPDSLSFGPRVTKIAQDLFVIIEQPSQGDQRKGIRVMQLSGTDLTQVDATGSIESIGDNLSVETLIYNKKGQSKNNTAFVLLTKQGCLLYKFDSNGVLKKNNIKINIGVTGSALTRQYSCSSLVVDHETGLLILMIVGYESTFDTSVALFLTCFIDEDLILESNKEYNFITYDEYPYHPVTGDKRGRKFSFINPANGKIEFMDSNYTFKTI